MWFKLAGATFTNNLGTMDSISKSYMMDYSGLTGLSASPGSVSYASDSTPDAKITFTIKSGYVFKSGSKVTASGGASKTYTASADIAAGNSFTMDLTGISGKVTFVGAAELVSSGGNTGGGEPETPVNPTNYTFTLNPTPTSATVTLSATGYSTVSGTGSKSITVANGTKVNWRVEASGYTTRTGNWTISSGNKTENIVLTTTGGGEETTTGLSYKLNRNIDTIGTMSIYNGRIAIPEFFETNGKAVTVSHSEGLEVLLRYYTKDKEFQSTADGSTYCRLVLRTNNEGSNDVEGTPLTNDTVNNTTLTINGTVYTLTNKIEENEIMYWINTNLNNKSPFLQVWNDRITIDDSFATNGTEATAVYNGSNYTNTIASRYFKTYTYVTDKTTSSNVRFIFVGNTGTTHPMNGTAITNNNILDGETLTVNGTIYTFI